MSRLLSFEGRLGTPLLPVRAPRLEPILFVIDAIVDLPFEGKEPFEFHGVQLTHRNIANFGPGFVLESVIIQKLASQKQSDRKHAVNLATAGGVNLGGRKHTHPTREVVKTQEDGSAWETSRRQNLKNVFPELRGHR